MDSEINMNCNIFRLFFHLITLNILHFLLKCPQVMLVILTESLCIREPIAPVNKHQLFYHLLCLPLENIKAWNEIKHWIEYQQPQSHLWYCQQFSCYYAGMTIPNKRLVKSKAHFISWREERCTVQLIPNHKNGMHWHFYNIAYLAYKLRRCCLTNTRRTGQ